MPVKKLQRTRTLVSFAPLPKRIRQRLPRRNQTLWWRRKQRTEWKPLKSEQPIWNKGGRPLQEGWLRLMLYASRKRKRSTLRVCFRERSTMKASSICKSWSSQSSSSNSSSSNLYKEKLNNCSITNFRFYSWTLLLVFCAYNDSANQVRVIIPFLFGTKKRVKFHLYLGQR